MSDKKHYLVVCGALALAGHKYKYGDTIELTDAQYAREFYQSRVRPAVAVVDTGAQDRIAELQEQVAELQAQLAEATKPDKTGKK